MNFTPGAQASSSQTIDQVAAADRYTGNTQDFGSRMIKLRARISCDERQEAG